MSGEKTKRFYFITSNITDGGRDPLSKLVETLNQPEWVGFNIIHIRSEKGMVASAIMERNQKEK